MKTSETKSRIVAVVFTVLFFSAVGGMIVLHDTNQSLEELLNGSKLKNETMLSEKLSLEKEIAGLRNQIVSQSGKSKELDALLKKANSDLAKKEAELKKRPANQVSKKDFEDLKKIRKELENEIAGLNDRVKSLEKENNRLTGELASAQSKNNELTDHIKLSESLAFNNFRVEASKRNKSLTVVAKRTKNLQMGFDLPQNLAENIKFKIRTPDGQTIDESNEALAFGIVEEDGADLLVSLDPLPGDMKVTKRVEMKYQPEKKMKRGVYTIDILNGETYVTSCQIKLK